MKGAIEVVRTPSPGFYSRLFLVPKARGTWRPIIDLSVLNTHIQCPSFKMETNGSLLNGSIHPSYRQYLRFCHEGVVWQFRALPFGLNTAPQVFTAVTASVVACAHLNGVSIHVYLDDWLIKTHIGRVSQTANPMVIGPLHTSRLGGKCGEVKPDSFTGGHLRGNFARYQSRPRLPHRKEDRTMALHLGGFPSGAGPACPAVVTTFGAPSFPRETSSLRPVAYPTHSVPTSLRMVSNQRSSSDPGQPGSRDPGFHSLVENSIKSLHKGIPLGSPLIEASSSQSQVLWVGVLTWTEGPPQEGGPRPWKSCTSMCWNWMRFGLVSKPSRIFSRTPMLPLCATMSLPLPIWEIRGALGLNRFPNRRLGR